MYHISLNKPSIKYEILTKNFRIPQGIADDGDYIKLRNSGDADVVEYAMSRNLSSTMIAEYRTKLIDKEILRAKLDELYEIEEDGEKSQQ